MAVNAESFNIGAGNSESVKRAGRTLVLGMGNTIMSDDGAGIAIARGVKNNPGFRARLANVDIIETSESGPALTLLLQGYETAIVVDAITTTGGVPGDVFVMSLASLKETRNTASPHSMNLFTAVELGKRLGMEMPGALSIVAVEAGDTVTVCERLTKAVEDAIPSAVEAVLNLLDN